MAVSKRPRTARAGESPRAQHFTYVVRWRLNGARDGVWQSKTVGHTKGHHAQAMALDTWLKAEGYAVEASDPRVAAFLVGVAPETAAAGQAEAEKKSTVAELVTAWCERPGLKPQTRTTYRATLKRLGDLGDITADELTKAQVNRWFNAHETAGLATKTLVSSRVVLKGATKGIVSRDVFADLNYDPQARDVQPHILSDAQIAELIASATRLGEGLALPIRVAAETGLRWGELVGLTARNIDIDAREIRVERQVAQAAKRNDGFNPVRLKTKRSRRVVPISDELADALALVRELDADAPVFAPSYAGSWCYDGFRKAWNRVKAGAPSVPSSTRFHDVRHSTIIRWLRRGVPLGYASKLAGHSDVRVTDQAYGQFADDAMRGVMLDAGLRL